MGGINLTSTKGKSHEFIYLAAHFKIQRVPILQPIKHDHRKLPKWPFAGRKEITMSLSKLIFAVILIALTACTAAPGARPTAFNYPPTYLSTFPLGSMNEDQMIDKMGPPDKVLDVGGKHRLVYNANQAGNMTYTFIFENDVVSDVIYNERGGLNGQTARKAQAEISK